MSTLSGGPNIVTNGLVLYLDAANVKSYVSGSTTWTDVSGNGRGGNLIGSASFTTGPEAFNTNCTTITDIGYLTPSSQITFADASSYTFDFWVKMRASAQATLHSLSGRGSTNPWLLINTNSTGGLSWDIRFRDDTGVYNNFSTITGTSIQNWTNVTVTADTSRNLSLYVNGVFRQTIVLTTSLFFVSRIAGGYSSGANQYNLQGSLASSKFYNRTLSATEALQNYNATKTRFGL
jgi:hypothetical protein